MKVLKLADVAPIIGNPQRPNYYQLELGIPLTGGLRGFLAARGISEQFISGDAGLLAFSAVLPSSSWATTESFNVTGKKQSFAHTKMYDTILCDFLVDAKEQKTLKLFESWIEFIGSGSGQFNVGQTSHYRSLQYPDSYKSQSTKIHIFNNSNSNVDDNLNIKSMQTYNFFGLFPKAINQVALGYDQKNEYMRVSVEFSYDDHVAGSVYSIDILNGVNNNLFGLRSTINNLDLVSNTLSQLNSGNLGPIFNF